MRGCVRPRWTTSYEPETAPAGPTGFQLFDWTTILLLIFFWPVGLCVEKAAETRSVASDYLATP